MLFILFAFVTSVAACTFPPSNTTIQIPQDLAFQPDATVDYFYFTGRIINTKHFDYHFTIGFQRTLDKWVYAAFLNDNEQLYSNEKYLFNSTNLTFDAPFQLQYKTEHSIFHFGPLSQKSDVCCQPGDFYQLRWSEGSSLTLQLTLKQMDVTFFYGERGFIRYSRNSNCDYGAYFAFPNFEVIQGTLAINGEPREIDLGNVYFEKQFMHIVDDTQAFLRFSWVYFGDKVNKYALNCPFAVEDRALCIVTHWNVVVAGSKVEQVEELNFFSSNPGTTNVAPTVFVKTSSGLQFLITPWSSTVEAKPGFFDGIASVELIGDNSRHSFVGYAEFRNH